MNDATQDALKLCPECGAENITLAKRCWMCQGDVTNAPTVVTAEIVEDEQPIRPQRALSEWFFLSLTVLLTGVILLVGVGIAGEEPGLLIPYGIFVVPAFIATAIRVGRRKAAGKPVSWGEMLATYFISTAVVICISGILLVALVVGFFVYCFVALASH